jgi:hypothetical protein
VIKSNASEFTDHRHSKRLSEQCVSDTAILSTKYRVKALEPRALNGSSILFVNGFFSWSGLIHKNAPPGKAIIPSLEVASVLATFDRRLFAKLSTPRNVVAGRHNASFVVGPNQNHTFEFDQA